jgi:DNA-binding transcriptional LysR family regulator
VTDLLAARGVSRRVLMTVHHLLIAPHVVATSDLVATLPERVANLFCSLLHVRTFDPPFVLSTPETALLWHNRLHNDPAHQWLRRAITEASRLTPAGGRRKRHTDA